MVTYYMSMHIYHITKYLPMSHKKIKVHQQVIINNDLQPANNDL